MSLAAAPVTAKPAEAPAKTAPSETTDARLRFLLNHLDHAGPRLRTWWIAWVATYATLTVFQAVAVGVVPEIFDDRGEARDLQRSLAIGASASTLGLIFMGINYPPTFRGSGSVRRLRDGTPEGEARALARAEALVRAAAKKQRFGRGWLSHVGGALVNLTAGLVIGLAFDRPVEAGVTAGVGTAINQAQIWTQPMDAARAWAAYRKRFPGSPSRADLAPGPRLRWSFVPHPGGLGLTLQW